MICRDRIAGFFLLLFGCLQNMGRHKIWYDNYRYLLSGYTFEREFSCSAPDFWLYVWYNEMIMAIILVDKNYYLSAFEIWPDKSRHLVAKEGPYKGVGLWVMVLKTTFLNLSAISCRPILLVEKTRVFRENQQPAPGQWQIYHMKLYQVHLAWCEIWTRNFSWSLVGGVVYGRSGFIRGGLLLVPFTTNYRNVKQVHLALSEIRTHNFSWLLVGVALGGL